METWEVILLVVVVSAVVLLVRLAPRLKDTIMWTLSGEPGSSMCRGVMVHTLRLRRTGRLHAVVAHLATITRLNLPLDSAVEAAADSESGTVRSILRQIARRLREGEPLSMALDATFRGCPRSVIAFLRRAEVCGQLPEALSDQERMMASALEMRVRSTPHMHHALLYAAFMLLFAGAMVAWIMVFLIPKFREIFSDYGTPLPAITLAMIGIASTVYAYGLFFVIGILLLVAVFAAGHVSFGAKRDGGLLAGAVARLRWALPVTRSLDYGLGMAKAIRSLAHGFRSGAPIQTLGMLPSVVSPSNHLRRRLSRFAEHAQAGAAPHAAAREAKLGDVLVGALKMVERGDDAERALGHAADYYEALAYRWWHALTALSGPLVTLALAALVGFVALALFLPLIALIESASETLW